MGVTTETKTVNVITVGLYEVKAADGDVLKVDRIVAEPGDRIRWDVGDRLVSIWFPESGAFLTPALAINHRGAVEATISESAERGKVYQYSIYDHDSKRFVVCESHPKLEIPPPGP